ncbi:MAG: hypothetical protein Q4G14_14525 [Paracoccus sp. (in: a-proteobacteria)]|uniref:hypothetical protein n=1 Tax=Paracoccus sp. TaxID=267 RepID=UPI0026DF8524|nr:hypothetical protein [Paracoccus sp. (in: a-proteobacteria)]MDO5614443.1 hypothetical protein [Paracoccus sp. (in: a-proteobacteria)]
MPQTTPITQPTARIEVFRPGTFTPMQGRAVSFTAADLAAVADSYDPATAPAPVVVGHPQTDAPAFGWAQSFDYDASGERLHANLGDIAPEFADAVKAGRYRKVSLAFFSPDAPANPVPGSWYPKHIGFLGGAAPAVSGLKNVEFSADQGGVVTFSQPLPARHGFDVAALIASFADFLAGQSGDPVAIDWSPAPERAPASSDPQPEQEPTVPTPEQSAAFAEQEAQFAAREAALAARETAARHADHAAFADSLIADGKMIPASRAALIGILDQLGASGEISFAEGGDTLTAADALQKLLRDQPKIVDFSALPDDAPAAHVNFASDGKPVDNEALAVVAKAQAYQRQHPGTEFIDAVHAVS